MKFVHCSDLHLGKKPSGKKEFSNTRYEDFFKAFEKLVNKIKEIEIELLIIAGDFFDKKEINADTLERTEKILKSLKDSKKDLRILVIEGNHDSINNIEFSWLEYLKNKNYIEVFSFKKDYQEQNFIKIGDINIFPVGYPGFMVDKVLQDLSEKLNPKEKNIVIVHTGFSDGNSLPGIVSREIIDLFKGKVIYMAGGHLHSYKTYPSETPYFFIPGSLEFANFPNETLDKKGAILFDTETLCHEFLEIEARRRIKCEDFSYESNIEDEFTEYVKKLELSGEEVIIVPINLKENDYINTERLVEIAEKNGALKAYITIKFLNNESKYGDILQLPVEDVENNIMKEWKFLNSPEKFSEKFTILKDIFSEGRKDEFLENLDSMLEEDENANKTD